MMKISEIASVKIEKLPLEKQQEVLDFIEFLQSKIKPEDCLDSKITNASDENDLIESFIGMIDTKRSDWADNHDQYLGKSLLETHDNQ